MELDARSSNVVPCEQNKTVVVGALVRLWSGVEYNTFCGLKGPKISIETSGTRQLINCPNSTAIYIQDAAPILDTFWSKETEQSPRLIRQILQSSVSQDLCPHRYKDETHILVANRRIPRLVVTVESIVILIVLTAVISSSLSLYSTSETCNSSLSLTAISRRGVGNP